MQIETLFELWRGMRAESVTAVREFPAEAFDAEIIPGFMSFRKLNRHILEAGQILLAMLLDGVENFQAPETRAKFASYPETVPADVSQADLAAALEAGLEERIGRLQAQPAEFWTRELTHFTGARVTMMEMLLLFRTHEAEHRAQAALLSRLQGIVPATTRKRQAPPKA